MKYWKTTISSLLLAAATSAGAGEPGNVQAHVEGSVSLVDLFGGPTIVDNFSLDGPPQALPLAGDATADGIIPSSASVQATVESNGISVVSEAGNLTGVEPATTSANATLQGDIGPGQWLLTVDSEHTTTLAGLDIAIDVEIAYSVTSSSGILVEETLVFNGPSNAVDTAMHAFGIDAGDTGTLSASIVADTSSPNIGTGLALSLVAFDLEAAADSDGDGVADAADNCLLAPNPNQLDSNGDGFGNICDADLNNDCIVNVLDLGLIKLVFFSADADADFNGDGVVNALDLGLMKLGFYEAPGPSGVANACD